jgi:hypothetical protein
MNKLHEFVHYFVTEWIYPLGFIFGLGFLSQHFLSDSGAVGVVIGVLLVCYVNSYEKK